MKKILLILLASFFIISCSDNNEEMLPNLSVLISSPDESVKHFGDTLGIYLGADMATEINVTITGISNNIEVYNNTLYYDSINGSCTGPGCLDCCAQNNGHPDDCDCNECQVSNTDFRYVGHWIATCDCDECLQGSYSLVAVATNENGQSGSATVEFSIQH